MMKIKIDFLKPGPDIPKRPKFSLLFLSLAALGILGVLFYWGLLPYYPHKTAQQKGNFWQKLTWLIASPERKVQGEEADRVNILLLGIGGKDHNGSNLTDTIMLASLKPSSNQLALISLPRDFAFNYRNWGWRKLNSVNSLAEDNQSGSGGAASAEAVSQILGQNIPYYIRINFSGFKNLIDEFGGVDVYVENTFDDYSYPVDGKEDAYPASERTEHVHFDAGWQHLNGTRALQYARSRHALGVEGSDFARARRQQKIMEAFKNKVLSLGTFVNPYRLEALISAYHDNVSTNLQLWEVMRLTNLIKQTDNTKTITKVFDNSAEGGLYDQTINGSYLLFPRAGIGNYQEMQDIANNIFNQSSSQLISDEKAKIIIENGTTVSGLAYRAAQEARHNGLNILFTRNAKEQTYLQTFVYDLSGGQKPNTATALANIFAAKVKTEMPTWLAEEKSTTTYSKPDFIIILGTDYSSRPQ